MKNKPVVGLMVWGFCLCVPCATQGQLLPYAASDQHLGVASCASTVCHGAVQPFRAAHVLQNEFITWQTDRYGNMHAKAYSKLLTESAQRIADNLGLPAAHKAAVCLQCHSDYVPEALRGPRFQLSDGVGCEACHGGSERWLDSHSDKRVSHAENIANGMYPTADPVARARLCLACHLGNEQRLMTHRIMGAGHPRLAFELDTFTYLQPHHQVDDDYRERKGEVDAMTVWAIGQALAAQQLLRLLADDEQQRTGLFPELVLFDCHGCHRSTRSRRWQPRASTGLGPGVVKVNDANLVMVRLILTAVAPSLSQRLQEQTRAMHAASHNDKSQFAASVAVLQATLDQAIPELQHHRFSARDPARIFQVLLEQGEHGAFNDYLAAEQAVMAAMNLIAVYQRRGLLADAQLETAVDALYASVADHERYRAAVLLQALRALQAQLP